MNVLIAPDKFKGSLTSFEACKAIVAGIQAIDPTIGTWQFPMADGGDGFAAVMKYYLHTTSVICPTEDPLGRPITISYELKGDIAIIEMASASGLILLKDEERNALKTSGFGTGILIKDAIARGAERIVLGLGGSATNDGGMGILAALGFRLIDKKGDPLKPIGENLIHIDRIIPPAQLPKIRWDVACDVQNVLYGLRGAAYVYAPQKGASPGDVKKLDEGLRHLADVIEKQYGKKIADIPGTGAAGGIAAGLMAFWDVRLVKGIDLVMDVSGIGDSFPQADMAITGEGKIDGQTLYGKVVSEISSLAAENKIPVVAFCGISTMEGSEVKQLGLSSVQVITPADMPLKTAMANADKLLAKKVSGYFGTISP